MIPVQNLRRGFSRAAKSYTGAAEVQTLMARELSGLIPAFDPQHPLRVLELGCGTGIFTQLLLQALSGCRVSLTLNDLSEEMLTECCRRIGPRPECTLLLGDLRELDLGEGYDLIACNCVLQWIDDLEPVLIKLASALTPLGTFLFSDFGPRHFWQLRALTGKGLDYRSSEDLRAMLARSGLFADLKEQLLHKSYPSARDLLHSLSESGVNRLGSGLWTPGRLRTFEQNYEKSYGDGEGVCLTWHLRYVKADLRYFD